MPTGYIDLDDAIELIVRHKSPGSGIILRAEGEEAFRDLCEFVLDKRVRPRGRTEDGKSFEADQDQFVDLQDDYAKLTTLRYAPVEDQTGFVSPRIEVPPSYKLKGKDGGLRLHARLVFLESEIDAALGSSGKGKVATRKRGRKPMLDWKQVEHEVECLMYDKGEFMPCYPRWNCLAQLEKAIANFISEKFDTIPAESTIRDHISPALEKWKEDKVKAGN